MKEEHLRNVMPLKEVQEKILQILYNGESIGRIRIRSDGGRARLLVGHNIEHDLDCQRMNYPDHLLRYKKIFLLFWLIYCFAVSVFGRICGIKTFLLYQ